MMRSVLVALSIIASTVSAQQDWPRQAEARQLVRQMTAPIDGLYEFSRPMATLRLALLNREVPRETLEAAARQYLWPSLEAEIPRCSETGASLLAAQATSDDLAAIAEIIRTRSDQHLAEETKQRVNQILTQIGQHMQRECRSPGDVIEAAVEQNREALLALGINPERPVRNAR